MAISWEQVEALDPELLARVVPGARTLIVDKANDLPRDPWANDAQADRARTLAAAHDATLVMQGARSHDGVPITSATLGPGSVTFGQATLSQLQGFERTQWGRLLLGMIRGAPGLRIPIGL